MKGGTIPPFQADDFVFSVNIGVAYLHTDRPRAERKTAKPPAQIEAAHHKAEAIQKLVDLIAA